MEFLDIFDSALFCMFAELGVERGPDRDELIQELALKLMAHDWRIIRRHLDGEFQFSFKAVLRTIVRSIVIDEWRRNRRWNETTELPEEPSVAEMMQISWAQDPADLYYRETRLSSILEGMVRKDRMAVAFHILYLRYVEELSVKEIAGQLRLAPNSVSKRISYYHARLADIFDGKAVVIGGERASLEKPTT